MTIPERILETLLVPMGMLLDLISPAIVVRQTEGKPTC